MLTKKFLIFFPLVIFLSSLVLAQEYKLEISTAKETFEAGEKITFKVVLRDTKNNLINDDIFVTLEDAGKRVRKEETIPSNKFIEIGLGEGASYGQGKISASYKGSEASGFFNIEVNELSKFELQEDNLIITNIGNTKYTKTIYIVIGDTIGMKNPNLEIGEHVSYRLIAPSGVYNIKVYDDKTTLEKSDVRLTGTGKAIGALPENSGGAGITGGISPDEENPEFLDYLKKSKFTYIFVFVIFGAMILLAIERRFRKKAQ